MSGSEHSNSSSPRYCPTPHQMPHPVPSPTPPPAMMHQVMPGHAQGHGHHTIPSQQQMNYYGYHNTPAQQIPSHTPVVHHQQAQYYGTQNPATGYYHHHPPPPAPPHLHHQPQQQQQQQHHPQNGYAQSVQWQSHHQGYYSHGYGGQPTNQYVPPQQSQQQQQQQQQQQRPPPQQHHQQQPPPPPMSPHLQHQQQQQQHQQIPRPGSNAVNYSDRNVGQGIPPQQPSSHGMGPQTEHVMSTSDGSGQHALMNLSRFVNQNQRSVTENRSPAPVNVDTTVINHRVVTPDNLRSIGSSVSTENITRSVPNLTTSTSSPVASLQQPQQQQQSRPSPPKSTVTTVALSPTTTITPVVSPASSVISSSGGGQTGMMPVRLQNARGARTKASMRKMLMEQTAESNKPETVENMEEPPAKRARRKPKGSDDSIDSPGSSSTPKASERKKSAPKSESPKRKSRSPKPSPTPAAKGSKKQGKQAAAASPSLETVASSTSSAPKKRGSRKSKAEVVPEIPDPSSSVNNVEEEIAKVLLDLKTGKSSPEKTGDVKKVEPPQEDPKKRQRRSSVRSIVESPEETPKPKGKRSAAKSVAKGTKAGKSKSAAAASPKTPKGKKSKTILAQSEQPEPPMQSASVTLSETEPIEEDFPVIHIPEVHSDTLIVVEGAEPSAEPLTLMSAQLDFGNISLETPKMLSLSTPPVNVNPPMTAATESPTAKPRRKSGAKKSEKAEEKPKETPKKQRSSKKKEQPSAPSPDEELPDLEPLDFPALIPTPLPPSKKPPKKEKKVSEAKAKKPKGPKKGAQPAPPPPVEPEPETQEFPVLSISEDTGISTISMPSSQPVVQISPKTKGKGKKASTPKAKSPKIAKPKAPKKSKKSKAAEVKEDISAVESSPISVALPVSQDQPEELTEKGNKKRKRSDTPKRQRQPARKKKSKLEEDTEEAPATEVKSLSQPFEAEALTANAESKTEPEAVVQSDTDVIERPSKTSKSPAGKSKTKAVKASPGTAKGAKTKRSSAKAAKPSKQVDIGAGVATSKSPKSKKAKAKPEQNEQPEDDGGVSSAGPSPATGKQSRAKTDGAISRSGKSTHEVTPTKGTKSMSEPPAAEAILTTTDVPGTDMVKSSSETPPVKGKKGKKVSPERSTPKVSKRAEKKVKPVPVETESTPTPERGRKKTPVRAPKVMTGTPPRGEVETPKSQKGKSPKRSESPKKEAGTPKHAEEHVRVSRRASSAGKSTASEDHTEKVLTDEVKSQQTSTNLIEPKLDEADRPVSQSAPVKIAVPPKKRFSKYDRATLDALENETIMEVSVAADDPLPPMEFFYQFEYSQRNNYPPSLPAPAKRKHAQLEARKTELLNELNQMSTPTIETELPKQPINASEDTLTTTEERTAAVGAKEKKASLAVSPAVATVAEKIVKKDRRLSTASQPVEKQAAVVESENVERSPPQEESAGSVNLSFIPAIAKPIKAPTVFVKSAPLGSSNMRTLSSGSGETDGKKKGSKSKKGPVENGMKHKTSKDAPSLRVEKGQVKFYRGGEEEDVEPPATKLRSERSTETFDSKVPWLCTFCKLGPHVNRLGDLFGPYYVNVARENHQEVTKDSSNNGQSEKGMKIEAQKRETWMHQDCALWASDLLLIGTSIRGLDKAVYEADRVACTVCGQKGATIGCLTRKCGQAAHFPCAQKMQWELDDETFLSYCSIHCKPPSLPL